MISTAKLFPLWNISPQLAYHDWATGLVRVNCSREEWQEIVAALSGHNKIDPQKREIAEAITHESVHFLQIVSTGYMYSLAVKLWLALRSSCTLPIQDVSALLKPIPQVQAEEVDRLLGDYLTPRSNGLSPSAIAEGQALHTQKAVHYPLLTSPHFSNDLDLYPSVYTSPYRFALARIGSEETVFKVLPAMSMLSLCTSEPVDTFEQLVESNALASLRGEEGVVSALQAVVEAYQDVPEKKGLDPPGILQERLGAHPVYFDALAQMGSMFASGQVDLATILLQPQSAIGMLDTVLLRPILFNGDDDSKFPLIIPLGLWPHESRAERHAKAKALAVLHALSRRVIRYRESLPGTLRR